MALTAEQIRLRDAQRREAGQAPPPAPSPAPHHTLGFIYDDGPPDPSWGDIGELFIDTDGKAFYGPKAPGGWGAPGALKGDPGDVGPPGPNVDVGVYADLTPEASVANPGLVVWAADVEGGKPYVSNGLGVGGAPAGWQAFAPGALEYPRGLVAAVHNDVPIPNTALTQAGGETDLPGFASADGFTFEYRGRPVVVRLRLPAAKYSVASAALKLVVRDESGAGVATNGKEITAEGSLAPEVANALWTMHLISPPISASADGTPFVAGTTYRWKGRILNTAIAGNGTFSTAWLAGTDFFGSASVIEV